MAQLGLVSTVMITFIFLVLVHTGQTLIWEQVAQAVGVAPVFVGTLAMGRLSTTSNKTIRGEPTCSPLQEPHDRR